MPSRPGDWTPSARGSKAQQGRRPPLLSVASGPRGGGARGCPLMFPDSPADTGGITRTTGPGTLGRVRARPMRAAVPWLLALSVGAAPVWGQAPSETGRDPAPPPASASVAPSAPPPPPTPGAPAAPPAPAAAPKAEGLRTFDPRGVRLTWSGRRWMLVADGTVLKDFGPREVDAR